jgi:hypothetical protein
MASDKEERIKQRAYQIWEEEGRPHGADLRHWLKAFEEIAAQHASAGKSDDGTRASGRTRKARTKEEPAKPAKKSAAATSAKPAKPASPKQKSLH